MCKNIPRTDTCNLCTAPPAGHFGEHRIRPGTCDSLDVEETHVHMKAENDTQCMGGREMRSRHGRSGEARLLRPGGGRGSYESGSLGTADG